jgi:hypothetical protein
VDLLQRILLKECPEETRDVKEVICIMAETGAEAEGATVVCEEEDSGEWRVVGFNPRAGLFAKESGPDLQNCIYLRQ